MNLKHTNEWKQIKINKKQFEEIKTLALANDIKIEQQIYLLLRRALIR